ncbi:glycosyltransferase family 4 protein [Flavobacteriales bacterium]|nr:glycosyltransferase family 4 protein [Flavobacteriales bacterium]
MRIAFDAKRAFLNHTGLGNYSRSVVESLNADSKEDEIFLCTPKISKQFPWLTSGDFEIVMPKLNLDKSFPSVWRSWSVIEQLKQSKVDLYHGLSNELPIGIKKSGIQSVVTIHDLIFLRYPSYYSKIDSLIYAYKVKRACWEADRIVAVSKQTKNDIIELLGVNADKIDVVYQTCQNQFKQPVSNQTLLKIKEQYGLPDSFILSVGTIEKRKNLTAVIEAIVELDETKLVVVGRKTPYFKEVESRLTKYDLANRVIFLHDVLFNDLPAIYRQAELLVYPSEYEGFGIPIIEGLYSEVPVITTSGGCFEEAGGAAARYVDFGDVEGMKNAISRLLNDDKLRMNMKEQGLEHARLFSNESVVKGLQETYHKALNS